MVSYQYWIVFRFDTVLQKDLMSTTNCIFAPILGFEQHVSLTYCFPEKACLNRPSSVSSWSFQDASCKQKHLLHFSTIYSNLTYTGGKYILSFFSHTNTESLMTIKLTVYLFLGRAPQNHQSLDQQTLTMDKVYKISTWKPFCLLKCQKILKNRICWNLGSYIQMFVGQTPSVNFNFWNLFLIKYNFPTNNCRLWKRFEISFMKQIIFFNEFGHN